MRIASIFAVLLLATAAQAQPNAQDDVFTGTLDEQDLTRDNDAPYDVYDVEVEMNEQLSISMESDDFDTYLIVRGPRDAEWINDDFEGSRNATVELIAEQSGTYTVWASAFGAQGTGDYTLTVDRQGVVEMDVTEGRLDYQDDQTIKGEYLDTHTVEMPAGTRYVVELLSLGFDGFLAVESPSGEVLRNDDAGSTTLSRVGPVEGEAGTWTVHITTVRPDEVGAYDLRVITRAE